MVEYEALCPAIGMKHSTTGTRAQVARVKAEYPSQLDYSGSCQGSGRRALCVNLLVRVGARVCVFVGVCVGGCVRIPGETQWPPV